MSIKPMDYFNKMPRFDCLSTANKEGKINVVYFGSPQMIDDKTIIMGLGKDRTFDYLQENSYGVIIIMEPEKVPTKWEGIRLYVKMTECHTSGEQYDSFKGQVSKYIGEAAAKIVHAVVAFEIHEIEPVVDFG
jgi:hypothetical protein